MPIVEVLQQDTLKSRGQAEQDKAVRALGFLVTCKAKIDGE